MSFSSLISWAQISLGFQKVPDFSHPSDVTQWPGAKTVFNNKHIQSIDSYRRSFPIS